MQNNVDFIAVSFVKSADVMNNLKSYVRSRSPSTIEIVAKIESFDSVPNVQVRRRRPTHPCPGCATVPLVRVPTG